jgi:hypothetical protein
MKLFSKTEKEIVDALFLLLGLALSIPMTSVTFVYASTEEGGGGDEGGNDDGGSSNDDDGGDGDSESSPGEEGIDPVEEPEPEPAQPQICPPLCGEDEPEPELEPERKPLPYCDTPEGEVAPSCHDLHDYDEETGLYPCNDGTQAAIPEDCPDATKNITSPSPQVVSPLAKEALPFMYQTSIEGIRNILKECWRIYTIESNYDDSKNKDITWFHKLAALKLAKECNEALFKLTAEGPSVMQVKLLEERLEKIETRQINR